MQQQQVNTNELWSEWLRERERTIAIHSQVSEWVSALDSLTWSAFFFLTAGQAHALRNARARAMISFSFAWMVSQSERACSGKPRSSGKRKRVRPFIRAKEKRACSKWTIARARAWPESETKQEAPNNVSSGYVSFRLMQPPPSSMTLPTAHTAGMRVSLTKKKELDEIWPSLESRTRARETLYLFRWEQAGAPKPLFCVRANLWLRNNKKEGGLKLYLFLPLHSGELMLILKSN